MAETKKTMIQQLSDLVEWFLGDRQVELRFEPVASKARRSTGKIAPEYDFVYMIDGRKITDKALAMLIMVDLAKRNYAFNLARIIAALFELSWRYYIANTEMPKYIRDPKTKRPVGRPRIHAPAIAFPEPPEPFDRSDRGYPEPNEPKPKRPVGHPRIFPLPKPPLPEVPDDFEREPADAVSVNSRDLGNE